MKPKKTVTLNLGQAGASPKDAAGSLKLKLKQGPLSKAFIRSFDKLLKMHNVRKHFDIALAVRPKKDEEPTAPRRRFMTSSKLGKHVDQIPGGKADNSKPSDFNPKELARGIEVEAEHTGANLNLAREIAMDHLKEDPRYYTKLKKIHKESQTPFGGLVAEWSELSEKKRKKRPRDMEEYGSPGAVIGKGGIGDQGHFPPTLGFPSS
jgi:hypothetical protein